MSQEPPPGQSDDEIESLAILVVENLQKGENPDEIVEQLVASGWAEDDAIGFVASIQNQIEQPQYTSGEGESEGMGWLIWIGVILLFNLLSYFFKWAF